MLNIRLAAFVLLFLAALPPATALELPQLHWTFDRIAVPGSAADTTRIGVDGQNRIVTRSLVVMNDENGAFGQSVANVFDLNGMLLGTWSCPAPDGEAEVDPNGFGVNASGKIVAWCGGALEIHATDGALQAQVPLPPHAAGGYGGVFVNDDGSFVVMHHPYLAEYDSGNQFVREFAFSGRPGMFLEVVGFSKLSDGRFIFQLRNSSSLLIVRADGTFDRELLTAGQVYSIATGPGLIAAAAYGCGTAIYDLALRFIACANGAYGNKPVASGQQYPVTATALAPDGALFQAAGPIVRFRQSARTFVSGVDFRVNPELVKTSTRSVSGHGVVDIDYAIHYAGAASVTTALLAFANDSQSLADVREVKTRIDGTAANIGPATPVGVTRRVSWDATQDLGSSGFVDLSVEVLANDGRGLVDVQLVEIPAGVPGASDPALTISTWPLQASDLLDAWYWLIATSDPRITFTNGEVRGSATSGGYSGQLLASGSTTTTQGENFICAIAGVRRATQGEIDRAFAGTTPGVQSYPAVSGVGPFPGAPNEIGVDVGSSGLWVVKLP